jgi:signal transduction histidine kinase
MAEDASSERSYTEVVDATMVERFRSLVMLGTPLYLGSAALDRLVNPARFEAFLAVRAVVSALLVGTLVLSRLPSMRSRIIWLTDLIIVAAGGSLCVMSRFVQDPDSDFHQGVGLVMLAMWIINSFRVAHSVAVGLLLIATYQWAATSAHASTVKIVDSTAFLSATLLLLALITRLYSAQHRREFVAAEELRRSERQLEARVRERTAELREKNDELLAHIEERRRAEAALARAHDELEERVAQRTAELAKANESLLGEIAERERIEAEKTQLNEELAESVLHLEAANKELEAFSYSVSHDLRAPLRAIDGFSLALAEDAGDAVGAEGREHIDRIRGAVKRMNGLVEALLSLSRLSRAPLERAEVDLAPIAQRVIDDLRSRAPERDAEIVMPAELRTRGDAQMLTVLLENLLGNAWKFTSKKPRCRIELGVRLEEGAPAYFVRDDGAGFDPASASRLFGAFQRLHSARDFEGTGIGLATVQRIVRRHGGRIWAEGAVDRGATFYFTLASGGAAEPSRPGASRAPA